MNRISLAFWLLTSIFLSLLISSCVIAWLLSVCISLPFMTTTEKWRPPFYYCLAAADHITVCKMSTLKKIVVQGSLRQLPNMAKHIAFQILWSCYGYSSQSDVQLGFLFSKKGCQGIANFVISLVLAKEMISGPMSCPRKNNQVSINSELERYSHKSNEMDWSNSLLA